MNLLDSYFHRIEQTDLAYERLTLISKLL